MPYHKLLFLLFFIASCQAKESKNDKSNTVQTVDNQANIIKKNILFFGNSLTAGYGLDDPSAESFVALIQSKVDSISTPYRCINAGLSGETTAGGSERVDWVLDQQPVSIFILELGGNDALRGIKPASSAKNLENIIKKVKAKYPSVKIVLAGMEAPRNMGTAFINEFHDIYPTLAKKNSLPLIPFLLENVGGIASLNQKDGIHPTAEGNKIIAETVWQTLKTVL